MRPAPEIDQSAPSASAGTTGRNVAGEATRKRLVESACEMFATVGIRGASLLEITERAGQRNRAAVHYHFGTRERLLAAVLDRDSGFLVSRHTHLADSVLAGSDNRLEPAVDALVRPLVELSETGDQGRWYLMVLRELMEQDPTAISDEVTAALAFIRDPTMLEVVRSRMPRMSEHEECERLILTLTFVLQAVTGRTTTRTVEVLSNLAVALLSAPPAHPMDPGGPESLRSASQPPAPRRSGQPSVSTSIE